MKRDALEHRLETFAEKQRICGNKGALCVMLVITRKASVSRPPYDADDFLSPRGGQVAGLGGAQVQGILKDHGITKTLAREGGRTSRGSIANMRALIALFNDLSKEKLLEFPKIEAWWVARIKEFLASKPFRLRLDPVKSLRTHEEERPVSLTRLIDECNGIVENRETDQSLKISLAD
jgi:hypothetical protein